MYQQTRIILIAAFLTGCVSIPKTPGELVNKTKVSASYCYAENTSLVQKRVQQYLAGCYKTVETDTMYITEDLIMILPLTVEFEVIEESIPGGKRYSVGNRHGFGYSAEVVKGSEACETTLALYAVTGFWRKSFTQTDLAAKGLKAECTL